MRSATCSSPSATPAAYGWSQSNSRAAQRSEASLQKAARAPLRRVTPPLAAAHDADDDERQERRARGCSARTDRRGTVREAHRVPTRGDRDGAEEIVGAQD